MKAILSIKPEFVERIFSGEKGVEYRRVCPAKMVDKFLIYATAPISKVVGEFDFYYILMSEPEDLWEKTEDFSGITKKFYDNYFRNKKLAYAIGISNPTQYNKPKTLKEFGIKRAPQSFCYIN